MSDENDELQTWIDPELEARVVALVLGEASAFEAAELKRIIAEKPELGIFKRRIEAVHGLVQAASQLETEPMRMDAARRAKLLEKLGQKESVAPAGAVMAMPEAKTDSPARSWGKTVAGIAACLVILALLASISMPAFTSVQSRAVLTKKLSDEKMAEMAKAEQDLAEAPQTRSAPLSFGITRTVAPTAPAPVAAPVAAPQRLAALDNLKALAGDMKAKEDQGGDETATAGGTMQTAPLDTAEHDWDPDAAHKFAQHITLGSGAELPSGYAAMLKHEAAQAEQQMAGAQQAQAGQSREEMQDTQQAAATGGQAEEAQAAIASSAVADEEKAAPAQTIAALERAEPAQARAEARAANSIADDKQMASDASAQGQAPAQQAELAQAQAALQSTGDAQAPIAFYRPLKAAQAKLADLPAAAAEAARSDANQSGNDANVDSTKAAALLGPPGPPAAPAQMPAMQERHAQDSVQQLARNEIDSDGNATVVQQQIQQSQQQAQQQLAVTGNGAVPPPMDAVSPRTEVSPPAGEAAEGGAPAETNERNNTDAAAKISGANTFTGGTTLNGGTVTINGIAANKPVTFNLGSQKTTATLAPALAYRGEAVAQGEQQAAGAQFSNAGPSTSYAATDAVNSDRTVHLGDAQVQAGALIDAFTGTAIQSQTSDAQIRYGSPISPTKVPVLGDVPVLGRTFRSFPVKQSVQVNDGNVSVAGTLNYKQAKTSDDLAENADELITKEYKVPMGSLPTAPVSGSPSLVNEAAKDFLAKKGVEFPPGASAAYFPKVGRLVVHDTESNLDIVDNSINSANSVPAKPPEDDAITAKLDRIIIPEIRFTDASVSDALDFLSTKSRDLDTQETNPARRGVKIVDHVVAKSGASPSAGEDQKITLSLDNIPLGDALKYVAQLSNLKLKTDASGVSLEPPSVGTEELITKEYAVPPGVIPLDASAVLVRMGVPLAPGAGALYDPATGLLTVHGSEETINLADAAIKRLQKPAPLPQDEISAADQPYSTFSLHVSDVSFLLAKNALAHGQMPDPEAIRPEEFYNAFDYGDPAPAAGQKIACRIEQAAHPMLQQRNLVRIAMKVAATGRGAGQPLRLTVLLDTSGSMEREDRAASVRRAMQALTSLLGPEDSVTLIGFARQPRLLAEAVPGNQAGKLVDIVKRTPAEGGTNMEEAIKAASELARRHLLAGAQNRVVMLTDGAANLGDADPEQLGKLVGKLRQQGVSFDACGVGANGFDDEILEALTRKGGGRYYFLNQPGDADDGFARELAGAFRPAAEDVKMQVRFNPSRVGNYRLIGFEKHRLKQEDFRNDKVTAAQLAAEEAAVALYQAQVLPEGEGEIGEVFVRFRDPATNAIVEQSWTIPYDAGAPALDKASPSMQLAATASLVAEKLRGGGIADAIDLDSLEPVVAQLRGEYPQQARVRDMVTMFEQTRRMTERR